jgi:hypothetical protein
MVMRPGLLVSFAAHSLYLPGRMQLHPVQLDDWVTVAGPAYVGIAPIVVVRLKAAA